MLLRWVLLGSLATIPAATIARAEKPPCCAAGSEVLSQHRIRTLLKRMAPIQGPCGSLTLSIQGTIVMAISVDAEGTVSSLRILSGHPMIAGAALESVSHWLFTPYTHKGARKGFCGRIALRFQAKGCRVTYKLA